MGFTRRSFGGGIDSHFPWNDLHQFLDTGIEDKMLTFI